MTALSPQVVLGTVNLTGNRLQVYPFIPNVIGVSVVDSVSGQDWTLPQIPRLLPAQSCAAIDVTQLRHLKEP
jgi:hypothetical protein